MKPLCVLLVRFLPKNAFHPPTLLFLCEFYFKALLAWTLTYDCPFECCGGVWWQWKTYKSWVLFTNWSTIPVRLYVLWRIMTWLHLTMQMWSFSTNLAHPLISELGEGTKKMPITQSLCRRYPQYPIRSKIFTLGSCRWVKALFSRD